MPEIRDIRTHSLELPLKDAFETAKGVKTTSPAVIIEFSLSNGVAGYGAATPVKYVTGEDIGSVLSAIESCAPDLRGAEASAWLPLFRTISDVLPDQHAARAGLEVAALDAFCKLYNMSMRRFFGGALQEVETDVTIPMVSREAARELAREAASRGFKCLKMKVGGDPEEDLARVTAAGEAAPDCSIRLDANQGFTPTTAVEFASKLVSARVAVDILEQPVDRNDLEGLRYVTEHTSVPVFADESALTVSDVCRLIRLGAADGINVKLMKSGISGALDIISACRAAGKKLMLGCMIETGIGLATAVHLACGTGAFGRLDLDAHLLTAEEPFAGGFAHEGPRLWADDGATGHGSLPAGE